MRFQGGEFGKADAAKKQYAYPNLTEPDITTHSPKIFHAIEGKLPQVSRIFASTCNQRQGNISVTSKEKETHQHFSRKCCRFEDKTITKKTTKNLPLYPVYSRPGWYQRKYSGYNIHKNVRRVIFIPTRPPQFIQPSSTNNEGGINFQPVAPECWILEIFLELLEIAFDAHVGKIWHHVGYDFESCIFGEMEGFGDGTDGMPSVRVASNVLVY